MNQADVRRYVERYLDAFSSHISESHPAYLTVKLPVEVDKDIGNRPFYWSWVERMNIPPQPMVLTFVFDPERVPEGVRGEHLHFGAGRLHQIFQSACKHGRFVCLYEERPKPADPASRRSAALTPWLCLNVKVSFVCDKKRDLLLSLGINLYQPRLVHGFYPFLRRLKLAPSIPSYHYLLERRISLEDAAAMAEQEVRRGIDGEDPAWAEQARERLREELEILEEYYRHLPREEAEGGEPKDRDQDADTDEPDVTAQPAGEVVPLPLAGRAPDPPALSSDSVPSPPPTLEEVRASGGRILDFLRLNGIPETPGEAADAGEWKSSTPEEEKARRIAELKWQYEPRIDVRVINGGLFYLFNQPPFTQALPL